MDRGARPSLEAHRREAVVSDGLDAGTHTGLFLDHVAEDRLYALFHLIAFRGLRRGEACGQKWTDTNLDAGLITVVKQLVVDGWEVYEDDPKTDTGARTIALDSDTVQALERHRAQQDKDRKEWENAWVETGRGRPEGHPGDARPLIDHHHGRHVHEPAP